MPASEIKVIAAGTVEGLDAAEPMATGVEIKERKSAVMTTIEVTPPRLSPRSTISASGS